MRACRCEQALIQNEVTDIFRDDFAALAEEDGMMSGNRKESIISEYQSFTHLTYSKNKVGHDICMCVLCLCVLLHVMHAPCYIFCDCMMVFWCFIQCACVCASYNVHVCVLCALRVSVLRAPCPSVGVRQLQG